jgi:orotate phosphoribosyltransferase
MFNNKECGLKVAEFLLQIKAIKLQPNDPFTWASGWNSPIYCDNRKILSYPKIRTYIRQQFVEMIVNVYGKPDVIAGVATGGIAIGALVAEEMGIPFVYVRSSTKGHGLQNKVEGVLDSSQNVVIVEDLVSSGKSSLDALEAIREIGCKVKGMAAIFTYGFEIAEDNFKESNCKLITLSDYTCLLKQATDSNYINENDILSLQEWRTSPSSWKQN